MGRKRPTATHNLVFGLLADLRSAGVPVGRGEEQDRLIEVLAGRLAGKDGQAVPELRQLQQNLINVVLEIEQRVQHAAPGEVHGFGATVNACCWFSSDDEDPMWGFLMGALHDMNEGHTVFEDHGLEPGPGDEAPEPEQPAPEKPVVADDVSIVERPGIPGLWHIPNGATYMWRHKRRIPDGMEFLPANEEARAYLRRFSPYPDEPDHGPEPDGPAGNPFYSPGDCERDRMIYPGIHPSYLEGP